MTEHLVDHQLHQHAELLAKLGLPRGTLAPPSLHLAAFVLYEVLICLVVTRLLWYALRRVEPYFSVSLLLAMFISGSIFSAAAIMHYDISAHF